MLNRKELTHREWLLILQKKGFQVSESLAIINRNGKYGLNKDFCQGIMKKANIEMLIT